jgi:hypothetical protein
VCGMPFRFRFRYVLPEYHHTSLPQPTTQTHATHTTLLPFESAAPALLDDDDKCGQLLGCQSKCIVIGTTDDDYTAMSMSMIGLNRVARPPFVVL